MKIFISWSGERSRQVAELFSEWLQVVIQSVEPWISSRDIDKGSIWFTQISEQLATISVGIICLTKENQEKPWILFETGGLVKGLSESRVIPFLVDLTTSEIDRNNPIAQLNHAAPTREDVLKLVKSINAKQVTPIKDNVLEITFERNWSFFNDAFQQIINNTPETTPAPVARPQNEILDEMLSTVRDLDKRVRNLQKPTEKRNWVPLTFEDKVSEDVLKKIDRENAARLAASWQRRKVPMKEIRLRLSKNYSEEEITSILVLADFIDDLDENKLTSL